MRILHVISSLFSGGAEKLVVEMCNYLVDNGHEVGLFVFVSDWDFFENRLNPDVLYFKNENEKFFSLKKIRALYNAIKKYDIIHVHLFHPFYIVAFLSFFFRNKKFVHTEHSTHNNRRKRRYKFIERIAYSRYSVTTCISEGVKKALENWITSSKTVLINNFVIIDEITKTKPIERKLLNLDSSDKILVMIGSFRDRQKDQNTLIQAMTLLPSNYKLLLIGEGILLKEKQELVEALELQKKVVLLGSRKDVYSILKACDYGVLSSNWEGFGIVALEYMACGLPAIGTNVQGLNEVIVEKECLFEVGDKERLAEIIMNLERDKQLKDQVVKSQQDRLQNYDISNVMNEFITLYKSLV